MHILSRCGFNQHEGKFVARGRGYFKRRVVRNIKNGKGKKGRHHFADSLNFQAVIIKFNLFAQMWFFPRPGEIKPVLIHHGGLRALNGGKLTQHHLRADTDQRHIIHPNQLHLLGQPVAHANSGQPLIKWHRPCHAGHGSHVCQFHVSHWLYFFDIAHARIHHPDIGFRDGVNRARRARHEANKNRDLLRHEKCGEGHAKYEAKIFRPVTKQHFEGDAAHGVTFPFFSQKSGA